jgi:hypothetical protein
VFRNLTVEIYAASILAITGGIGTVIFRLRGPVPMILVMGLFLLVGNLINEATNEWFWTWNPIWGLSTLWTGVISEAAVSLWIPITSWFTGKVVFSEYWPK